MSDFKTRLDDEKGQLDEKIEKLESFIESDKLQVVAPIQQSLLKAQLLSMKTYSQILAERISWL